MKVRYYHLLLTLLFTAFAGNLVAQEELPTWKRSHFLSAEEMEKLSKTSRRAFDPTDPPPAPVRQTAEFERMQSILIRYPFGIPYTMIAEISENCFVTTLVTNQSQENTVRNYYINNGVNIDNCDFIHAPTDSYWTRDYGPWFITKNPTSFGIVDFTYNRALPPWYRMDDNNVPVVVAGELSIDLYNMGLIHTGGNYMTDGLGVGASTTLVYTENPTLSEEEIDTIFSDFLGIHTYHVLPDPLGDYIEHIDCWGKFLDVDKVLIGQVPVSDPRYADFEYVADYFADQICSYGYNYEVIRVETPGTYPYTPYTNSLIVNNKVLVPQTGHELDDEAIDVYEAAMPGYEIIGILDNGWMNTDAIHCRARGIADIGMLYLQHFPLFGEVPYEDEFEVELNITTYSGSALYSDSLKVYYKVNSGVYSSVPLEQVFGNKYRALIPGQDVGSEISYYIFAVDESGRREMHPFIGSPDPHVFTVGEPLNPDVTVTPDSLFFTDYLQCDTGLKVKVLNSNTVDIVINDINNEGYDAGFAWWIDPWTIDLPYTLSPGDSLMLNVKIGLTTNTPTNWLIDTLFVETDASIHNTFICVDETLLSTPETEIQKSMFNVYPNPFNHEINITMTSVSGPVKVELYNTGGILLSSERFIVGDNSLQSVKYTPETENIGRGLYYLRIHHKEGIHTEKLLKIN